MAAAASGSFLGCNDSSFLFAYAAMKLMDAERPLLVVSERSQDTEEG